MKRYEEHGSAAKGRPVFDAMMADARRGRFAVLLVWALDRFGRSMAGNMTDVLGLDRLGVHVVSVREPWLDAGGPDALPADRDLLVGRRARGASSSIARTKAGIERARAKGIRLGRPPARFDVARARTMQAAGGSLEHIARTLHVPKSTLFRALGASSRAEKGSSKGEG